MMSQDQYQDPSTMAFDVFISYSSRNKLTADAMKQYLQSRGIRCWKAPDDIVHGESWAKAIPKAIRNSQIMVLIWTKDSMKSSQVINELTLADRAKKLIIPFRTEEIEPEDEFEYYLAKTHWLDAFGADRNDDFELLTQRVRRNLIENPEPSGKALFNKNTVSTPQSNTIHEYTDIPRIKNDAEPGLGSESSVLTFQEDCLNNWFTDHEIRQAMAALSYYSPLVEASLIKEDIDKGYRLDDVSRYADLIGAFSYEESLGGNRIILALSNESIIIFGAKETKSYTALSLEIGFRNHNSDAAEICLNNDTWTVCAYRAELLDYISDTVCFVESYINALRAKRLARKGDYSAALKHALSSAESLRKLSALVDIGESLLLSSCLVLNAFGGRENVRTLLSEYLPSIESEGQSLLACHTLSPFVARNIMKLREDVLLERSCSKTQSEDSALHSLFHGKIHDNEDIHDSCEPHEMLQEIKESIERCRQDQGFLWDGGSDPDEEAIALALSTGMIEELDDSWREMITTRQQYLPAGDYLIARGMSTLSAILRVQGKLEDAFEYAFQALELRLRSSEGASSYAANRERLNVARILALMDRTDESCRYLTQIIACYGKTDGSNKIAWRSLAAEAISFRKQLLGS